MTVDDALKELQKLSNSGYGTAKLLLRNTSSGVTEEISSIGDLSVYEEGQYDPEECLEDLLENEEEYVLVYI